MPREPTVPKKSGPPKGTGFGDSIPAGEIREMGEETGWAEWNDAIEQTDRQFAQTAPMTAPFPPGGGDPRYAKTAPSGLPATDKGDGTPAPRKKKKLTSDEVMVDARKNNRVCPKPRRWAELFGQFSQWTGEGTELPSPPLTGDIWNRTPALAKRMSFRDHIEWAEAQGCLEQFQEWLKELPEEDWHHMGD